MLALIFFKEVVNEYILTVDARKKTNSIRCEKRYVYDHRILGLECELLRNAVPHFAEEETEIHNGIDS